MKSDGMIPVRFSHNFPAFDGNAPLKVAVCRV